MTNDKLTTLMKKEHPYLDSEVLIQDEVDQVISDGFECLTWLLDGNDYWEPSFWERITGAQPDKAKELAAKASRIMNLE